jgi:hypothetical protein
MEVAEMQKAFSMLFGLGLLLAAGAATAQPTERTPEIIQSNIGSRSTPMWVEAQAAASGRGGIRPDLFSQNDVQTLREHAEANLAGRVAQGRPSALPKGHRPAAGIDCTQLFGVPSVDRLEPKPNRTLADLVDRSRSILSGRVTQVEQGFFDGLPYSLLQITVNEALRAASGEPAPHVVYAAYPYARFVIDDEVYCTGMTDAFAPSAGDRVLFFVYDDSLDSDVPLYAPKLEELAFESRSNGLILGGLLGGDDELAPVHSLLEIEKLVRADLKKGGTK